MFSLALAAVAIAAACVILNLRAYDGFFSDDELDNLGWPPRLPAIDFLRALFSPFFQTDNFRPAGHAYFAIMGRIFGLDFPPYITPLFTVHLINGALIYSILRRLQVGAWQALAGAAFFVLSAGAFDAYWKPMYVFDTFCTFFCLLALFLYAHGRIVFAFIAFWLAYKSKELAVMLPAVLVLYEYWFGSRRFLRLIPFLLVSLSFGLQGILLNPNKDNEYTFRFTLDALRATVPFYSSRFLLFPFSGIALFALALVRDRRIWFGLAGMAILLTTLLFLPGRLYIAYAYLPLAFAAMAIAAAASHVHPAFVWLLLALWMPGDLRELHNRIHATLADDDAAASFVSRIVRWSAKHPDIKTLVYDGAPTHFHHWGVTAAWNFARHSDGEHAFFYDWPRAAPVLLSENVAYAHWDRGSTTIRIHSPGVPTQ